LLAHDFIPQRLRPAWSSTFEIALTCVRAAYARAGAVRTIRLHGDCHIGNVLWREGEMNAGAGTHTNADRGAGAGTHTNADRRAHINSGAGPHFVDFDDARSGPAIQDLWMLFPQSRDERKPMMDALLRGYEDFCEFDDRELHLIEALRTLRLLHYSAWLARRWDDPAFPAAFPWFNTERYWEERILELKEQVAAMEEA
jgi:Ser/Thr protein kinase RdoA (MazF antagonist)